MRRPHLRNNLAAAFALAALVLPEQAPSPGHGVGNPPASVAPHLSGAAPESLLARADAHWRAERYDLAAQEFAEGFRLQPEGQSGERAGVMAARALLELGRPEEALVPLEAVAHADTGEYWWGQALVQLARLAPTAEARREAPSEKLTREARAARTRQQLARAINHFRGRAAADSVWQAALIDADSELLSRLSSVEELDRALDRARADVISAEQEAELQMAYVLGLSRIPSRAFLPEKQAIEEGERRERMRRALERVMHELGNTTRTPAAYARYIEAFGHRKYLRELLERYPDSREAAETKRFLGRLIEPSIHISVIETSAPEDTVRIHISIDNLGEVDCAVMRIGIEDRLWSILGSRKRIANPKAILAQLPSHLRSRRGVLSWLSHGWGGAGDRRRLVARARVLGLVEGTHDTTLSMLLPRGYYEVRVRPRGPEARDPHFTVGDLRLHARASADSIHAIVTTSAGLPAAGAEILAYAWPRVRDREQRRKQRVEFIAKRLIDASGRFDLAIPQDRDLGRYFLVAWRGEDAECSWVEPWWETSGAHLHAWTDRTVYRPKETVHFQALGLRPPVHHWTPAVGETLHIKAHMPGRAGRHATERAGWDSVLVTDRFGTARGAFVLPADVADGMVHITGAPAVQIAAFERLDFSVRAVPRRPDFSPGEVVEIEIEAMTTHGLPLAGASVTCSISRVDLLRMHPTPAAQAPSTWYEPRKETPPFRVSGNPLPFEPSTVGEKLGPDGRVHLRIPTVSWRRASPPPTAEPGTRRGTVAERDATRLEGLAMEITVDDGAGRRRSTSCVIPHFPESAWCMTGRSDRSGRVEIWRLNNRNEPSPGLVHYRWLRLIPDLERDYYVEQVLESGSVPTASDGGALLARPRSDTLLVALDVWAESGAPRWTWNTYWPRPPNSRPELEIELDRPQYAIGDTARLWRSPESRERTGLLFLRRRPYFLWLAGMDSLIPLPVRPSHLPSVEVSLTSVDGGLGGRAAKWIVVEPSSRLLRVEVECDREVYTPGDTAEIHIETRDSMRRPVEAMLTVAAVDEAVFAFAEDKLEIERSLYQLEDANAALALRAGVVSIPPPLVVHPPAPAPPRLAFRPTAFWHAVITDPATGRAVVRAKLPDDLARWRVTVRAVDTDGRVGQALGTFRTEHGVQIRPRLPRFARVGDHFEFGALVDNRTDRPLRLRVTWLASNLRPSGPTSRTLNVGPGQIGEATFAAEAVRIGADSLTIAVEPIEVGRGRVTSPVVEDRIRLVFPIEPAQSPDLRASEERTRSLSYSAARVLAGFAGSLTADANNPPSKLAVLLRYREGTKLLAAEGKSDPSLPALEPDERMLDRLRRELVDYESQAKREKDDSGLEWATRSILSLLCDLEEARRWDGGKKGRRPETASLPGSPIGSKAPFLLPRSGRTSRLLSRSSDEEGRSTWTGCGANGGHWVRGGERFSPR